MLLNVIKDSRKSSEKESVKLYLDAVNSTIYKQNLKAKYEPDSCIIQSTGDLICQSEDEDIYLDENKENNILSIDMKGKKPSEGTIFFANGKISTGENIKYSDLYYTITNGEVLNGTKKKTNIITGVIARLQTSAEGITATCEILDTMTMKCGNESITIQQKEHKAMEGRIAFINGEITSYKNLKIDGKYYHKNQVGKTSETTNKKEYLCNMISDSDDSGTITKGDKYECKVNDNDTFNFYVLTEPSNNEANLIMDRNICNDGTTNYTEANNYCRYQWYSTTTNNTYGPVTAITELYKGTKNWNNVDDMIMNYIDESNNESEDKGYTSIITSNGLTTITGKPIDKTMTIGAKGKPLKARLPRYDEMTKAGCTGYAGTCPTWIIENMTYSNVSNDKYSTNNNNEIYQNQIKGYWLLASGGHTFWSNRIECSGVVRSDNTTNLNTGIRPVVTINIYDML